MPWTGRARRADVICGLALVASGIYGLALIPTIPALIGHHALLLELLSGSTPALVAGGANARVGHNSLEAAIVLGVIGTMIFDPLYWWAGRLWGRNAAHALAGRGPRGNRLVARAERWAERFGWVAILFAYYLPVPNPIIYAAAGWTGMRFRTFLLLDILGALLWVALGVGLGYAIGQSAVDVAKSVSHYALYLGLGLTVVIVAYQVRRAQVAASA
jgi:membrane protein DedA with SNARE-associated domain